MKKTTNKNKHIVDDIVAHIVDDIIAHIVDDIIAHIVDDIVAHIVDDIVAHIVDVFVSKIDFNISHISDHNHFIVALILSLVVHPFVFWHDFYDTYNVPQYFVNIVAHDIVA